MPQRAPQSVQQVREWLADINPGYRADPFDPRSSNCGSCALAVHERLSGRHATAGRSTLSIEEMEVFTGVPQVEMSPSEIEAVLRASGPGAHAVVGIDRTNAPGHWFNAYFDGERVVAIDGQRNMIADWPPDYGSAQHPVVYWDAGVAQR